MKAHTLLLITAALLGVTVQQGVAERASPAEATNVARNWVTQEIARDGNWGGSPEAEVGTVAEFARGSRLLGYYFPVNPQGFVVVSLHKELAAVKAWSDTSNIDPACDEGPADTIKLGLERMIEGVRMKLGRDPDLAAPHELDGVLEINYRDHWDRLSVSPDLFGDSLESGAPVGDYQSPILLTSSWHQQWPYNAWCPNLGCSDPALNSHAYVGCVATAGAQIMRYWCWPPWGSVVPYNDSYIWPDMPDRLMWASPTNEIDAVAELCSEVGVNVGMSYGCDGSGADTADMEGVFQSPYRYSTACAVYYRKDYDADNWWQLLKNNLVIDRPMQYRIVKHSIVCDAFRETGDPVLREYHMNYGWDNGYNAWYTLDALYYPAGGSTDDEYIVSNIVPDQALGTSLSGVYPKETFNYRYVDRNATCTTSATFDSGQWIQFLPNRVMQASSGSTGWLTINGSAVGPNYTRMFARGDKTLGCVIYSGTIRMQRGGAIALR